MLNRSQSTSVVPIKVRSHQGVRGGVPPLVVACEPQDLELTMTEDQEVQEWPQVEMVVQGEPQ